MRPIRAHLTFANVISMVALFVALGGTGYAATQLAKNSVGAKQIRKNAVKASEIAAGAVRTPDIRANAINGSKIPDGAVTGADLADNGVGGADIADEGVGGADIADEGVGGADIANDAVGAGEIADNAVAGSELADGSVGSADVANESLGTNDVTDGTLLAGDFAADQLGPTAFARIAGDGTLVGGAGQSKGIAAGNVQKNAGAPATESTGPGVYCIGGLSFTPRSAVVTLDNTDSLPLVPAVQGGSLNFIPTTAIFKGEDFSRCDTAHGQVRVAIERVDQTNPPELVDHGFFIWIQG
jgi:hypothetical protein